MPDLPPIGASRARAVLRLGGCVLAAAAAAGVWEVLASQAPGSMLYLGVLPGPIERLRREAFDVAVLLLIGGLLLGDRALPRPFLTGLQAGAGLVLCAGLYAAAAGMTGVQMTDDLRPDAGWVFGGKMLGRALLSAGFLGLGHQALFHRSRER